jgi:hypothetical protein
VNSCGTQGETLTARAADDGVQRTRERHLMAGFNKRTLRVQPPLGRRSRPAGATCFARPLQGQQSTGLTAVLVRQPREQERARLACGSG